MTGADGVRAEENQREKERKKQVVILWFLSRLVLPGGGGVRPRPLLPETAEGYAGGDAGRMLIRRNANWKEARERGDGGGGGRRPLPASAGGRSLKCSNQVVIVSRLNPAHSETV